MGRIGHNDHRRPADDLLAQLLRPVLVPVGRRGPHGLPPGLPGDHFGVQVDSLDELNIVQARAEAFSAGDDRVEILPYEVEDHTVLKLHAFYVRYLLPMSIEGQYFELTPG